MTRQAELMHRKSDWGASIGAHTEQLVEKHQWLSKQIRKEHGNGTMESLMWCAEYGSFYTEGAMKVGIPDFEKIATKSQKKMNKIWEPKKTEAYNTEQLQKCCPLMIENVEMLLKLGPTDPLPLKAIEMINTDAETNLNGKIVEYMQRQTAIQAEIDFDDLSEDELESKQEQLVQVQEDMGLQILSKRTSIRERMQLLANQG